MSTGKYINNYTSSAMATAREPFAAFLDTIITLSSCIFVVLADFYNFIVDFITLIFLKIINENFKANNTKITASPAHEKNKVHRREVIKYLFNNRSAAGTANLRNPYPDFTQQITVGRPARSGRLKTTTGYLRRIIMLNYNLYNKKGEELVSSVENNDDWSRIRPISELIDILYEYEFDRCKLDALSLIQEEKEYLLHSKKDPGYIHHISAIYNYKIFGIWYDILRACYETSYYEMLFQTDFEDGLVPFEKANILPFMKSILSSGTFLVKQKLWEEEVDWRINDIYQETMLEDLISSLDRVVFDTDPERKEIILCRIPEDFIVGLQVVNTELMTLKEELKQRKCS